MKTYMTPEEHARLHRRRARQALGLLVAVLVLVGAVTVVRAGVRTVAKLFDDTQQRQEYEDELEGLVLFDPVPFDGIENIDDLTLREAAVWGCVYSIQLQHRPRHRAAPAPLGGCGRLPCQARGPQLQDEP